MRKFSLLWVAALLVIGTLILASCKPTENQTAVSPSPTDTASSNNLSGETGSTEQEALPAETALPTPDQPTPTPIIETRLPPERWQEWPVVPELTGREQEIFKHGLSLANDPTSFSKVGDCQAIKDVLMGIYDQPDRYVLFENDAYLQETIDHFAGSFNRDGQGVRGGYNAAAVLSPIWADPEACQPGENPIECEDRIHNPSFVIISLEVWWEGRTVERYEAYMRQIIDFYIENGVVPILSTKADNVEGDHRINLATARLAYEYHIPLWNFWLAVQPMSNHGIDPNRDGFHISYEAWTVRSYTALQALDAVWRGVQDLESTPQVPSATPETKVNFAAINIQPTINTTPLVLTNERLIFSVTQRSGEATRSAGVYAFDLAANTLHRILKEGFQLEDMDASGRRLLVSQGSQLYLSDPNGKLTPLTDRLAEADNSASAYWLPDGNRFIALTDGTGLQNLWLMNTTDSSQQILAKGEISGILKPAGDTAFFWFQGSCDSSENCENVELWRSQGGASERFAEQPQIRFSADGSIYAWTEMTDGETLIVYTRNQDQTSQDYVYLPENRSVDLTWSPISQQFALLTVTRSDYSGKSSDARIFVIDATMLSFLEYYAFPGLTPTAHWSADASELLLTSTLAIEAGYQLHFRQMNLASGLFDVLDETLQFTSDDFITIDQLFWITP